MLFVDKNQYIYIEPAGQILLDHRDLFLTKRAYHTFTGYARGQLYKLDHVAQTSDLGAKRKALVTRFGFDTKNASNNALPNDKPFKEIIQWVHNLYKAGYYIVFVSGRSTDCAIETEEWLAIHCPTYDYLFIRNGGDSRKDAIVKQEILDKLPKDRIEFVIDDRPSVIEMWRANGLKVYPVNQERWVGCE